MPHFKRSAENFPVQDGDYKTDRLVSPERLLATVLVGIWTCIAYSIGGLPLAVRSFLIFMIPLAMVWLPELLARIAVRDDHWRREFSPPVSGLLVRIVAWLVILGVPTVWLLFFRASA